MWKSKTKTWSWRPKIKFVISFACEYPERCFHSICKQTFVHVRGNLSKRPECLLTNFMQTLIRQLIIFYKTSMKTFALKISLTRLVFMNQTHVLMLSTYSSVDSDGEIWKHVNFSFSLRHQTPKALLSPSQSTKVVAFHVSTWKNVTIDVYMGEKRVWSKANSHQMKKLFVSNSKRSGSSSELKCFRSDVDNDVDGSDSFVMQMRAQNEWCGKLIHQHFLCL